MSDEVYGALDRIVAGMTIDMIKAYEARQRRLAGGRAGEMLHQIQVPVSGKVKEWVVWQEFNVIFPYPVIYSPAARSDNAFENPHFSQGFEWTSGEPVIIHAHVIRWNYDNQTSWIVGARIRWGAQSSAQAQPPPPPGAMNQAAAPTPARPRPFAGVLHLTFSGYSAPSDEETNQ